jgi:Secretion system C-terminal sorting domain
VVRRAGIDAVKVFPNPFVENINVSYYSNVNTTAVIKLVDMSGKTIAQTMNKTIKGSNQVTIANLNNIAGGIYLVQVADAANTIYFVQKVKK